VPQIFGNNGQIKGSGRGSYDQIAQAGVMTSAFRVIFESARYPSDNCIHGQDTIPETLSDRVQPG
jgi:hypothetical protein